MATINQYNSKDLSEYISVDNSTLGFIRENAASGFALLSAITYKLVCCDDALLKLVQNNEVENPDKNKLSIKDDLLWVGNVEIQKYLKNNASGLNDEYIFQLKPIEHNSAYVLLGINLNNNHKIELLTSVLNEQKKYIFRCDEKGLIKYINERFTEYFTSIYKSDKNVIQTFVHPEDITLLEATIVQARNDLKRNFPIRLHLKKRGEEAFQLVEFDFQAIKVQENTETHYQFQAIGSNANEATLTKAHLIDKNLQLTSIQQALYNSAIIAIGDKDGRILDINDRFTKMSGFTKEELIGKNFSQLSAVKKAENAWEKFWENIDLNNYWRGEICNISKSGDLYWLDSIISPVLGIDGSIQKFISISQDITQIKTTQATLKLTKDQLEQTGRLARVGGWELNLETSELTWSTITKEIHEVPPSFEPDLNNAIRFYKEGRYRERITQLVQDAIKYGTPYDEETIIITDTGKECWVRVIGNAEFSFGKCVRIFGVIQDISQLKQTQISDALNSARLEVAAEYSGIGIWEYDARNHKEYWDYQMLKLYQYEREEYEATSNPWEKKLFTDDLPKAVKEFEDSLENGINYDSIYRILWPNNELRYIHAKGRVFRDENDEVISIIGTNLDITDQKKLEDELRYNQYVFEQSGKLAKIGSWVVNLGSKKTVEWSAVTKEIHGVPVDYVHDFDKDDYFYSFEGSVMDIKQLYYVVIRYKKDVDVEFNIRTYNDEYRWVRCIAHPEFNDKGKCVRIIGTIQDITKQKEEADRLKTAEKLAGVGTFHYYAQTNELYWSEIAKEIFGIEKEIYKFEDYVSRIHKDDRELAISIYQNSVANKTDFRYTHRLVMDDGRVKYANFFGENIYDNNGDIYLSRGTLQDITKMKVAELELIKSRTEAIEANKAKSNFLANMSHEIRTPLNGVIGFNELLSHTPLNAIQLQYLENANTSAQTLLSVLNDILDFSKIEAGKLELDPTRTDLIEVIQSTANIFKYAVQKKGIEILIDIKPDLPSEVLVDQLRLQQVLSNLLSNAVKFTEEGSLTIQVDFKRLKSSKNVKKGKFLFKIIDTGIGISKSQQQNLFKAFSQADPSTSRKYGGTGLGLVIANSILDHMNTKLKLKSEIGKGSTFYFDLKLEYGYKNEFHTHTIDHIKKALIIDDNTDVTRILSTHLAHWGISTDIANSAEKAKNLLMQNTGYDVVILDYHLPNKTGLEILAEVKKENTSATDDLTVILLHSSSDDENLLNESNKLGIHSILEKPFNSLDIFRALTKINGNESNQIIGRTEKTIRVKPYKILDETLSPNILIVEDVALNSTLVKALIKRYLPSAKVYEVTNGVEAVNHYKKKGADFIFMDIQMPVMDGYEATKKIRSYEKEHKLLPTVIVALTAHAFAEEQQKVLTIGMNDILTKPVDPSKISNALSNYLKIASSSNTNLSSIESTDIAFDSSLETALYDKIAVQNRFLFDEDLIAEMLLKAKSQIHEANLVLKTAFDDNDRQQIAKSAHKIKGIAKNMSFVQLIKIASELEEKADESSVIIDKIYKKLDKSIYELFEYLGI